MTSQRWPDQDTYADLIESAAAANGVPTSIAYGLIGQESGFNAQAIRQEPTYRCARTGAIGDASYGLTQVLYCTAQDLGYTDAPTGLFDPATNLSLGLLLLGRLLQSHGGDAGAALSAYNGGDRPSLGFGTRQADGTFRNQQYVDNVLNNAAYFDQYLAERDGTPQPTTDATDGTDAGSGDSTTSTGLAIAGGLLAGGVLYGLFRLLRQ